MIDPAKTYSAAVLAAWAREVKRAMRAIERERKANK
jgi:hypothetical protein